MNKKFDIVEKTVAYDGFFSLIQYKVRHQLFNGGTSNIYTREVLERGHAVAVLLHDRQSDEIVLIEQFRIGAIASHQPWLIELVAGIVEEGESVEEVARRETLEECGATIKELTFIADFYNSAGGSSEKTTLFYANIDSSTIKGTHGLASENEDILVIKMTAEEFIQQLDNKAFQSASLITAGYWFKSLKAS